MNYEQNLEISIEKIKINWFNLKYFNLLLIFISSILFILSKELS